MRNIFISIRGAENKVGWLAERSFDVVVVVVGGGLKEGEVRLNGVMKY